MQPVQSNSRTTEEMAVNPAHSRHDPEPSPFWSSRYAIGLLIMGGVAGYLLLNEHRAHFFGALPYLLLLACPLMHVFMHGGHGGHSGHGHHGGSPTDQQPRSSTPDVPKTNNIGDQR